ncbi:hypothetical protein CLOSYM_00124 [[Clostridium] symbiosum ATCC 14940]|uniref:Uncharacterized protein n=1 Tax=[Clostridium] symbiosum ATCC 14940 TaxID=411472 RepID=A0ABC9U435_CLOSY|nr:hypothetical protein CLOSYM_00124 [[Clostridium] symbiosum ATCC 14940]
MGGAPFSLSFHLHCIMTAAEWCKEHIWMLYQMKAGRYCSPQ